MSLLVTIGRATLSIAGWGRRWGVSRTRARQRIHVAMGLCEACNLSRVTARHCRRHADEWNRRARVRSPLRVDLRLDTADGRRR